MNSTELADLGYDHRRLPAVAAAQARDRRPRHRAARQRLYHRRLPAIAAAQARDRRSRHRAARRRLYHRRLPAVAAAQARDRRPRHRAARQRLITAAFPPLRQPKPEIADRGAVRLGSGSHHRRLPAVAAAQTRDRRSRRRAARQRLHHRRLPAVAAAQAGDRRSRRRAARQRLASPPPSRHCGSPSRRSPIAAPCGSAAAPSPPPSRRCGSPNPRSPMRGTVRLGSGAITAASRRIVSNFVNHRGNRSVRDG